MPNYAVGSNVPGYLPDGDGPTYITDSFEDAKRYLIHEIKFQENYADDEDAAENFCAAAEEVNLWSSPQSITVDDDPTGSHSLGRAFWIMETDEEVEDDA